MSHQEMSLLVKAQNPSTAETKTHAFMLDTVSYERPFFDDYAILTNAICPLSSELDRLCSLHTTHDPQSLIAKFLAQAEILKAQQNFEAAGYCYHLVGDLYQNRLVDDIPFYNVSLRNYDIPVDPAGWFLVPIDCHY